jgi:predicted phage tail protein
MEELEVLDRLPKQKEIARLLTPSGPQELSVTAVAGETIQELIDRAIPEELKGYIMAFNRGVAIADPSTFYIQESDSIVLAVVPQGGGGGGKSILATVLTIAVIAAAWYYAPVLAGTGAAGAGTAGMGLGATIGTQAVAMGLSMVGMMAISALIPPPEAPNGGEQSSPTYSLGGTQNAVRKYQPVARIYGKHKVFPAIASTPLVTNLGTESIMKYSIEKHVSQTFLEILDHNIS